MGARSNAVIARAQHVGRYYPTTRRVAVDALDNTLEDVQILLSEGYRPYGFTACVGPWEITQGHHGLRVLFQDLGECVVTPAHDGSERVSDFIRRAAAWLGSRV